MRVLIVGGTSFIGPAVVRRLCARGCELLLYHRGKTEAEGLPDVPHIHADRTHLADHVPRLGQFAPDVVVDMNLGTAQEAWTTMRAFRRVARRIVVPSSIDVYRAHGRLNGREPGPLDPDPFTEDEGPFRDHLYPYRELAEPAPDEDRRRRNLEYDKILVEHVVRGDPVLPATVLRLPMVFGPGDFQHRMFSYLRAMRDGRPAIVMADVMAQWRGARGFVENVAEAIALAVVDDRARGRTYNLADEPQLTEIEWVSRIGTAAGWSGAVRVFANDLLGEPLRADPAFRQHWVVDTTRIRRELGYAEPVASAEAIGRTVSWELAHPPAGVGPADYAVEDRFLASRARAL